MTIAIDLSNLPAITNDKFYPLFWNDSRFLVLYGGAGSGKSEFAALKMLVRILNEPGHRMLCIRKVAKTLRHSVFALLVEIIHRNEWGALFRVYRGELKIECVNGGEILFAGLDDPEKLKSITGVTSMWIEEATELAEDDLDQINLRMRGVTKYAKQIVLTFNPISAHHWIKKRFFDRIRPRVTVLHTTYKDNRFLDAEYCEVLESLATQNPHFHKVYALGLWGMLKGLVYRPFDCLAKWPKTFEDEFYGLDFGFNNPTALIGIGMADGVAHLTEKIYETQLTNPELIKRMREEGISETAHIYADSASPDRIEEIRLAGFWGIRAAEKGQGSVEAGINYCQSVKIRTKASNVNIAKESEMYCWRVDKNGNPMDEPVKFADHAMDAMRYALWSHLGKSRWSPFRINRAEAGM